MFEILPRSHDGVFGVKATGKITAKDYEDVLIPKLDDIIEKYGKVRFLYYLAEEFTGFEPGAMWDDMKYGTGHMDSFERVAVVGGSKWMEWITKLCGLFTKNRVRSFKEEDLKSAWDWIDA
ncbi:MAG: STAS/SEC14 domain-containing protein [Candidatus Omnitrophota bacterium]